MYTYYVVLSFVTGVAFAVLLRYVGDFPFPWEFRRKCPNPEGNPEQPDSFGLCESLMKLKDGYEFNAVMGNMNAKVCNTESVLKALETALAKDVKINIICGPFIDKKSQKFLKLLDNPKVKLFQLDQWPERHFRVIKNEKGKPIWVYVEEPHRPFESNGFRCAKSSRLARQYQEIFEKIKQKAHPCIVKDFLREEAI